MSPSGSNSGDDGQAPENMLFLFTDQQRKDSIGAYGNETVATPNLDRLSDGGTRFERAYTPTAICSPARASLVSGVRPTTHGITRNVRADTTLDEEFPCYPQLLRDSGYNVGLVGKWHVGKHPGAFGFDGEHYYGYMHPLEHDDYVAYLDDRDLPRWSDDVVDPYPSTESEYVIGGVDTRPVEASFTYFVAERTIERLESYAEECPERPFYLSSHFFGPHRPYFLPEQYFDMYDLTDVDLPESAVKELFENKPVVQRQRYHKTDLEALSLRQWRKMIAVYWGFVTFIDDQVGRILDVLDECDLVDRTAVVFSSDHGSFVTAHKNVDKGPLMYEDIYNVPMIARGIDYDASTNDEFVSLLDLAPTFLDIAGVEIPDIYEGRSLNDLGDEMTEWRSEITAEFHGLNFPYEQRMLRTDRFKYVLNASDVDELYDLQEDPHELTNKIDNPEYAETRARLERRLGTILEERNDLELPDDEWLYPALSTDYFPKLSEHGDE